MAPGKSEFVTHLFEEQATPLLRYLIARFKNADEAREIAQEAWLRIYRLENPEQLDNAKAFLFQTASNLSIDRIRRANLERTHAEESNSFLRPEKWLSTQYLISALSKGFAQTMPNRKIPVF